MGGIVLAVLWVTALPIAVFVGGAIWTLTFGHFMIEDADDAGVS